MIGKVIRHYRRAKLMRQADLSERALVNQPNLSRIENELYLPRAETLRRIADALGVNPEAILNPPAEIVAKIPSDDAREDLSAEITRLRASNAELLAMLKTILDHSYPYYCSLNDEMQLRVRNFGSREFGQLIEVVESAEAK